MATIFSNANGQVVRASDGLGDYYYVADGLGDPHSGAWAQEEDAMAALDGEGPEPDIEMDERGYRLVQCACCATQVRLEEAVPATDDDEAWERLAMDHADDCEWIATRAHRI